MMGVKNHQTAIFSLSSQLFLDLTPKFTSLSKSLNVACDRSPGLEGSPVTEFYTSWLIFPLIPNHTDHDSVSMACSQGNTNIQNSFSIHVDISPVSNVKSTQHVQLKMHLHQKSRKMVNKNRLFSLEFCYWSCF